MTDLLISYFEKFGDKPCCGNDLKLYLPIIQDATETALSVQRVPINRVQNVALECTTPACLYPKEQEGGPHPLGQSQVCQALLFVGARTLCAARRPRPMRHEP